MTKETDDKYVWNRKDIKNKWILLTSKFQDEDIRRDYWDDEWNLIENDNDKNIKLDGFSVNISNNQIQYWIDIEKADYNEKDEITIFNEKCKYWKFGKYVDNKVILSLDDVNFDRFEFVKDDFENYILKYNEENLKKEPYIKSNIEYFEVEFNERFNKKYIKLQYNDDNMLLFDFIKKFDEKIQKTIKEDKNNYNINIHQYNYLSCIKEDDYQNNNYIELKIKNSYIEPKIYNNAIIYIRCNRLWSTNYIRKEEEVYSWGISLTIDKIIEN